MYKIFTFKVAPIFDRIKAAPQNDYLAHVEDFVVAVEDVTGAGVLRAPVARRHQHTLVLLSTYICTTHILALLIFS